MAIVQCKNGHYYDNSKFMECPHCQKTESSRDNSEESKTMYLPHDMVSDEILRYNLEQKKPSYQETFDDQKTVAIFSRSKGNDFVTGWLVCTKGPEKGRDYRLHYGFNKLGRSSGQDIYIEEDKQISRLTHCAIVYEYNKNEFFVVPQSGNIVYVNGEFIGESQKLVTGDVLTIGASDFEFVAFCREERKWEKE